MEKSFKEQAKIAKKRMRSGYWENLKSQKDSALSGDLQRYEIAEIEEKYKKIAASTNKKGFEDKEFLEKVREILNSKVEVLNPLKLLISEEELAGLDYAARQRLILQTSEKFKRAKEFIANEEKE